MPRVAVQEFEPLLDSADFDPTDWTKIAMAVADAYYDYDGFVIVQGTDTMSYTASALSFMLENLGKTVILTGSQIPFADPTNDARRNLVMSVMLAGQSEFSEVCVYFGNQLMRGNRSVKVHSQLLNAFESPNFPPLALIGATVIKNTDRALPHPKGRFRVCTDLEDRLLVIRLVPGFSDDGLFALIQGCTGLRAIVLEVYGTGNIPGRRQRLLEALRAAKKAGVNIVAVTQCLTGSVNLDEYAVGQAFKEIGVISAGDMTLECAVTKLSYLLCKVDSEKLPELFCRSLRGELTARESQGWRSRL